MALQMLQDFFVKGAYGVSVFFVLSGFLLSHPFWVSFLANRPLPSVREFARRRALRIVPGFYLSLLCSFALTMIFVKDAQQPWLRLMAGLSFTNSVHYLTFFPTDLNGPLWSIGFEVVCYALLALCMAAVFRFARAPAVNLEARAWTAWLGVIALALIVNQLIVTYLVPNSVNRGWEYGIIGGAKAWMPGYNPVGLFGHFALGVLAALFVAGRSARRPQGNQSWMFDLSGLTAALIAGALLFALHFWQPGNPMEPEQNGIQGQPYLYPIFPSLVAVLLASLPFSRVLWRGFDHRLARFTATVSFGLYLWHYALLEVVRLSLASDWTYTGVRDPARFAGIAVACLAGSYLIAWLSYRFVESPFLALGKAAPRLEPGRAVTPSP